MSIASVATKSVRAPAAGYIHNAEIAELFDRYAILLEMKGANPFRVRAYRNAARTIENLPRDINRMLDEGSNLAELPGIGEDLAKKIAEITLTGQFAPLEELKKDLPAHLADLAQIPGLGPKRINVLFRKLGITSIATLASAARTGRLRKLRGFGPVIEHKILESIKHREFSPTRLRLSVAEHIAIPLLDYLKRIPGVQQAIIAGSYRRRKETVGDIDILITAKNGVDAIEHFVTYREVSEVLAKGTTRATVHLKSGLQVDLRVVPKHSYGAALVYFTGSKAHNITLRSIAIKHGLKFNEYGVFKGARKLAGETEKEVYARAGLPYIAPELRENQGEFDAARKGTLPRLVTLADIKGDLHSHTDASDGESTIEQMAEAARARNYEYLAVTDHSKHMGIVHGLDVHRLRRQMAKIDRLNAKYRGFRLLKSAEVDILPNGSLAIDTGIISELDIVVAAIHTAFGLDVQKQTERLIRAMDNRAVTIIAHPTGRLLGEREPYHLDMTRVMKSALERGCFLEVNAQPTRLDLNDIYCRLAKNIGLKVAISTDAHSDETLDYMRFGVDQARRGWIEAGDVINTHNLGSLLKLIRR